MSRLISLLMRCLPVCLAGGIYAYSLRLPLFLDDGILYQMIRDFNGLPAPFRFWAGSSAFGYYRPFAFSLLEINDLLNGGRLNPVLAHGINWALFMLSCALLVSLVRRLTGDTRVAVLAGIVWALMPFNARAVTWVSASFHLLMLTGLLLSVRASLLWQAGRAWGFSLALFGAFMALFSQETGVLVTPLVALALGHQRGWRAIQHPRQARLLALLVGLSLLYLLLYISVPRPAASPFTLYWQDLGDNLAIFGQAWAFPVASLIRRLTLQNGQALPLLALSVGVVLALAWLCRAQWRAYGTLVLMGGCISLPSLLLLSRDYLNGTIHPLVAVTPFVAAVWGLALMSLWRWQGRWQNLGRLLGLMLIVWIGVVGLGYHGARRAEALRQTAFMNDLLASLQADKGADILLINAPAYLHPRDEDRWFLMVNEATMFMEGSYTNHAQIYRATTGEQIPALSAILLDLTFVMPPEYVFAPFQTEYGTDISARLRQVDLSYLVRYDVAQDRFVIERITPADVDAFIETLQALDAQRRAGS